MRRPMPNRGPNEWKGIMTRLRTCRAWLVGLIAVLALPAVAQERPGLLTPTIGSPQYFAVLVSDANRSAQWYQAAFGLRELDRSSADDGSWQVVNLTNDQLLVEIIRDNRAEPVTRARGFFKVGFHVPDVDVVADAVDRAAGERPRIIDIPNQGIRIVQIRDPDGNVIQLFSRRRR